MRGVCVGIILAASLSLVSVPTAAASSGPCTLLGYESRSGGTPREIEQRAHQGRGDVGVTDLSSSHWRVDPRSKLIVQQVGLGPQPAPQGWLTAFGVLRYPLFKLGQGRRDVWYAGPWDGQQLAPLARRWGLEIQAGSCTGSTVLEFRGHPLLSAAGVGGNLLGVLGLIGLVRVALRHRRSVPRPGDRPTYPAARRLAAAGAGLGLGLLAGVGEGVWMQQAGTISPLDARSLLVPLGGLLLGLAAGTVGGVRMKSKPIQSAPGVELFELPGYEPLGIIGEGANGTLYLARQLELDRLVAIRRLPTELSHDRTLMRRFRQSAADQSRLRHPNWAEVYALRTHGGHAYLVTEFVEGASLHHVMKAVGRLTPEQALGVMSGVLKGLAHAHDLGLVHGALRPENVIVDTSGTSKLVDLGLPGRPNAYWSPEQRTTLRTERLSDVYAAGVMLHELLTGRLIETAGVEVAAGHVSAELGPPIAALIRRAVDETPDRRQPSARAFLHDLERSAEGSYGSDWQSRASIAEAVAVAAATGATAARVSRAGG